MKNYNLPRFERRLMRPDIEFVGKEIGFPKWRCYCCHDSGFVNPTLVKLIIPQYNPDKDLLPVCQRSSCEIGAKYMDSTNISSSLDWRFGNKICQKLDEIHREQWRIEKELFVEKLKLRDLAEEKSLRKVDRSGLEEDRAQQNHRIERSL